ncbi:hypothetical protein TWF696_001498 [Orbilia brochopaga]|uniref:Uncharacterized protein n=1 Tax=Orbilia brochopaga TaxID=3140254 RepID=A0AAV9UAI8_9PEZI
MHSTVVKTTTHSAMTVLEPVNHTIPGYPCPTCAAKGIETIVINGRSCPKCGTEIDVNKPKDA